MFKSISYLLLGLGLAGVLVLYSTSSNQAIAAVTGNNIAVNMNISNTAIAVDGGNQTGRISEDGNVVVWKSTSNDIVVNDNSHHSAKNLFIKNIKSGVTKAVDVDINGNISNGISHFDSFQISRTGRYVAFTTSLPNMVASPATNGYEHIYLRDTQLNTTQMVDVTPSGTAANYVANSIPEDSAVPASVSDDGRFVVFNTNARNLLTSGNPTGSVSTQSYIRDMWTGEIRYSVAGMNGERPNGSTVSVRTSCDGMIGVFTSNSTNLTPEDNGKSNVYVVDYRQGYRVTNVTSHANQGATGSTISCNGRYITMQSSSTNLMAESTTSAHGQLYRYDRLTGEYELITKSTSGYVGTTKMSYRSVVSDDGKVFFISQDQNLVTPAAIYTIEWYLRDPEAGTTEVVPVNSNGIERGTGTTSTEGMYTGAISANGKYVIYTSFATDLVPGIGSTHSKKIVRSELN